MMSEISVCGLPDDVLKDILLQFDSVESLKAAAQSCKTFYSVIRAQPSIICKVLENEVPAPVLPYAYALLKCEWERYSMASNEDKNSLLDKVFDGTTDFSTFFPPDLKLRWAAALEISKFFQLVKRLTSRAGKSAFRNIGNELNNRGEHGRLENFQKRGLEWLDTEAFRVYLAFYRVELHVRLFATTHGAELSFEMEKNFFLRLQPWECEQIMVLWRWMIIRTGQTLDQLLEKEQNAFWELYLGPSALSVGLLLVEAILISTTARSLRRLLRRYVGVSYPFRNGTAFHYGELPMHQHIHQATKNLRFEEPLEPIDPELGPRSAVFAVYHDWELYYNGWRMVHDGLEIDHDEFVMQHDLSMLTMREGRRLKIDSLFHAFWDYGRIVDADLLPLFASLAINSDTVIRPKARWSLSTKRAITEVKTMIEAG